jgi:uncharacterized surface protein with fasciclin (FAS1) repeats
MMKQIFCTLAALSIVISPALSMDMTTKSGEKHPCLYTKMKKACTKSCKKSSGDVIDVTVESGQFKTLAKAIEAAGLTETLKTSENITIFAPTDKAFEALPKGQLETLLKPENKETLRKLLNNHVVAQEVMQKDLKAQESLTSLDGNNLKISKSGSKIMINGANLLKQSMLTKNGVVQGIDKVLIP